MNRVPPLAAACMLILPLLAPPSASAGTLRDADGGGSGRREVVVAPGWPVRRPLPRVVARRPAIVPRTSPARFLPVLIFRPMLVVAPVADRLVWQDAETLFREEDWAETVFNSGQRGDRLYLQVNRGRVQFDFAEVVFGNGDTQVVDFGRWLHGPGLYSLLDFRDGRRVDHVRLVARARSGEARVALLMAK